MQLSKANVIVQYCTMIMAFIGGMCATFVLLSVMRQLGEETYLVGGMVDMLVGIGLVKYVTENTARRKWLLARYRWVITADLLAIPVLVAGSLYDPSYRYLLMCTVGVTFYFLTNALRNDCLHRQMGQDELTSYGEKLSRYEGIGSLTGMMIAYYVTTLDLDVYALGVGLLAISGAVDTYALHIRINAKVPEE